MGAIEILETWFEPITGPLNEFRTQAQALTDIHQNSVNDFNTLINDLTDPSVAEPFSGPGADAMQTVADNYFTTELPISDMTMLSTGPLAEAATACETTVGDIIAALGTTASQVADTGPLTTVTEVVDASVLLQGGVDVPDDIAGAGITLVEGAILVGILLILAGELLFIWLNWQTIMNGLVAIMNPPLPSTPHTVQPVNLNSQQMQTAKELEREFGGDISLADIEQMIADHPQWTKERIRQELLRNLLKKGSGYFKTLVGKTITVNGKKITLTETDLEAMIKSGYTYTHFGVLLGVLPLANATTPAGRPLSWHALADSIPRHKITLQEIDDAIDNYSRTARSSDGSTAYIKKTPQGYTLVIENSSGQIVTAMKSLKPVELRNFGRNYGFDINP